MLYRNQGAVGGLGITPEGKLQQICPAIPILVCGGSADQAVGAFPTIIIANCDDGKDETLADYGDSTVEAVEIDGANGPNHARTSRDESVGSSGGRGGGGEVDDVANIHRERPADGAGGLRCGGRGDNECLMAAILNDNASTDAA